MNYFNIHNRTKKIVKLDTNQSIIAQVREIKLFDLSEHL